MTWTNFGSSPVSATFLAIAFLASGVCAQQDTSPPASQEKHASFNLPELPRFSVDTSMPEQAGRVIEVPADGNFQQAIDDACLEDIGTRARISRRNRNPVFPKKRGFCHRLCPKICDWVLKNERNFRCVLRTAFPLF